LCLSTLRVTLPLVAPTVVQSRAVPLDAELDVDALWAIAHGAARATVSDGALRRMARNRRTFERAVAAGEPVYGVTTGFGALVDAAVGPEADVGRNLLRSHAAAAGDGALPRAMVRAAIAARAAVLARARSGVRPEVAKALVALLDHDLVPRVPAGPLGAAGDLAPAAHIHLLLLGEGETVDGETGAAALARAGLEPLELDGREALALISGTSLPVSAAALAAVRMRRVLDAADVAAAVAFDALGAAPEPLDARVYELRPGARGAARSAANLRRLLGTPAGGDRLQDALSLRSAPQIHGAAREAGERLAEVAHAELGAVSDNPLIFDEPPHVVPNGSFHAQSIAAACDAARAALADLASVSDRRTFRMLSPATGFLSPGGGGQSGYMIVQYTAASLVTELRLLAHPVAPDGIPVSAGQEDHAANAMLAAGTLWTALGHVERVVAIELLCACQALDLRGGDAAPGVGLARAIVREHVPALERDRPPAPDVARIAALVGDGVFSALLE
jgi:histidine ammonia-lyase